LIEFNSVSRHFGTKRALDDASFTVPDGSITGLVGHNGAGKTTAMKILVGILRPTTGSATIDGKPFAEVHLPMTAVGVCISAEWIPKDRRAIDVMLSLAMTHGITRSRCYDLLTLVGLHEVAQKRVGTFSMGMRQRLGLAIALLGDPKHLILDEPVTGLDPDGVAWIRRFLKSFVNEGKCVLLSSHLMSELENTADRVVVITKGRVVANDTIHSLVSAADCSTYAEAENTARLVELLGMSGYEATLLDKGILVANATPRQISAVAAEGGLLLDRLEPRQKSLEDVFFHLTGNDGLSAKEVA